MPGRAALIKHSQQKRPYKLQEPALRGTVLVLRRRRIFHARLLMRITQHLAVQARLAAKVIVDRRHIGPGAATDFPHRGVAVSLLGEDLPGRFQQPLPRFPLPVAADLDGSI